MGVLGGVDGIAFAGGIGENAPAIRARTLAPLAGLGLHSTTRGTTPRGGPKARSRAAGSAARVFVIPTNEEILIARDTMQLVAGRPPS